MWFCSLETCISLWVQTFIGDAVKIKNISTHIMIPFLSYCLFMTQNHLLISE